MLCPHYYRIEAPSGPGAQVPTPAKVAAIRANSLRASIRGEAFRSSLLARQRRQKDENGERTYGSIKRPIPTTNTP